jgi:hypothetical protein
MGFWYIFFIFIDIDKYLKTFSYVTSVFQVNNPNWHIITEWENRIITRTKMTSIEDIFIGG